MELLLPAMFDNRREKYKWTLMPFTGLLLMLLFGFVPMVIFLSIEIVVLISIFSIAIFLLIILGFWYLVSIPSFIILDPNFIFMKRFGMKEYHPLNQIARITRMSSGIIHIKMQNGKEIIRVGINDGIILQLRDFHARHFLVSDGKRDTLSPLLKQDIFHS
jgi:hypothetical protein